MIVNDRQQSPMPAAPPSASGTAAWCADCHDVSCYPAADAGPAALAWAFLRRNSQYRDAFGALVELVECGGADSELRQLHDGFARRWGVIALVDPARDSPPLWRSWAPGRIADHNDSGLDRFVTLTFDVARPLRPQLQAVQSALAGAAVRWCEAHPDDAPATRRLGKEKNPEFYIECLRALDAEAQGVPHAAIGRELWPTLDADLQRRRLNYRLGRGRALVNGDYLELAANANWAPGGGAGQAFGRGQISDEVVFPCAPPVDRVA